MKCPKCKGKTIEIKEHKEEVEGKIVYKKGFECIECGEKTLREV